MSLETLSHSTMEEIREDEEKWLKFFTKRSLTGVIIGAVPGYLIFSIVGIFAPSWAGLIAWAVIEVAMFAITSVRLSVEEKRNRGGGQYMYIVILRRISKRLNREVYIKMNRNEEDET